MSPPFSSPWRDGRPPAAASRHCRAHNQASDSQDGRTASPLSLRAPLAATGAGISMSKVTERPGNVWKGSTRFHIGAGFSPGDDADNSGGLRYAHHIAQVCAILGRIARVGPKFGSIRIRVSE